jgi:hypothetical protein
MAIDLPPAHISTRRELTLGLSHGNRVMLRLVQERTFFLERVLQRGRAWPLKDVTTALESLLSM